MVVVVVVEAAPGPVGEPVSTLVYLLYIITYHLTTTDAAQASVVVVVLVVGVAFVVGVVVVVGAVVSGRI